MRKVCHHKSQHSRFEIEGALHAEAVEDKVDLVEGDEAILNWVHGRARRR